MFDNVWKPWPGAQTEYLSRQEDEVLFGGRKGPGKTDCILADATGAPETDGGKFDIEKKNYKALILRRTFPQLQELIDRAHSRFDRYAKWSSKENRFTFKSGAKIEFGHCQHEEDKRRYWGKEFQFIGYDQLEEFTETQYRFINLSNRTSDPSIRCRIRGTANPGGPGHWWVKRRFIDGKKPNETHRLEFILPDKRIATKTIAFIPGSYKDNPALTDQYLAQLMDLPEIEKMAYMDGDWDVFLTQSVFGSNAILMQRKKSVDPRWVGSLKDLADRIDFVKHDDGNLKIYEVPDDTEEYILGGDVSYGYKGASSDSEDVGDASSLHVIKKRTWDVVATWHGWVDPEELGDIAWLLGHYYCSALIGIEINGPGIATINRLKKREYPNLYRYAPDKTGWLTNVQSRHSLISTMQAITKEGAAFIYDQDTLDEMSNFIRNVKTGKIEAREGCRDDRIMSLGIAWQIARVNPYEKPNPRKRAFGGGVDEGSSMDFIGGRQKAKRHMHGRFFNRHL